MMPELNGRTVVVLSCSSNNLVRDHDFQVDKPVMEKPFEYYTDSNAKSNTTMCKYSMEFYEWKTFSFTYPFVNNYIRNYILRK